VEIALAGMEVTPAKNGGILKLSYGKMVGLKLRNWVGFVRIVRGKSMAKK
jgi:hypothetical protein